MRHLIKVGLVLFLGAALASRLTAQTAGISQLLSLSVPVKSGTVLPTKCNNPSLFYKTNAGVPGQNIYACTAPDTWSLTGAGGAGTGTVTTIGFTGGLLSIANPTTTPALTIAGNTGGLVFFNSPTTWLSTPTLSANLPLFGGGAGTAPFTGTRQGNTTAVVTYAGSAPATNDCPKFDASGNLTTSGAPCGGGTGGPVTSDTILIWDQTHTSSTLTLGTNCTSGHPCPVDGTSITGPVVVTITSSPGETEYFYINLANGHLVCGSNTAVLVCSGGDLVTGITAFPTGSFPLYTATTTATPTWNTVTDVRSFLSKLNLSGGTNVTCTYTTPFNVSCDIASAYIVANSRRVCDIAIGDTSASALTDAQLGPQKRVCYIPQSATIVEMVVAADAGTPNVIVGRSRAGTVVNIVSGALATAASGGIACSNTGGTTGIDGVTTCSSTLQNTSLAAGDYLQLVSGTAGGTAKLVTAHLVYTVN